MPLPKLGIHLILPSLIQSFQLFLVVISRGLSVAVILFHSLKLFTSPSSFVFIPNQPAVLSLCIALSSVLLHLILALRTSPPRVTVEGSRFLPPYKQYCMFVLFGLTCIPYGVACHALFRYPGLDDKRHEHIINTVVLLHALLVEMFRRNMEVYGMPDQWIQAFKAARRTITTGVILESLLFLSGAPCLFVLDRINREFLWLLPSFMLWTQFTLYGVMLYHKVASSIRRQLVLNIIFYGVAALASLALAIVGIVLQWHLTFVEQYLFLQALFIWSTYRLSSVLHEVLPGKKHSSFDPETASGPCYALLA